MYDFVSHSGWVVISRRIFEFLDFENLKVASEVSTNWHDYIARRSLWLRHFKIFKKKKAEQFEELRRDDWQDFFNKFEEGATFDEVIEIIQMFETNEFNFFVEPLYCVCHSGPLKLFKAYLRLYNLDVNKRLIDEELGTDQTVLHIVALMANTEIVKYILTLAKDKNPMNNFKITPLEIAIHNGHFEMTRLIYQHVPCESEVWKKPLIHDALYAGNIQVLKLIEPHLNFDQEENGQHPLETAITTWDLDLFKYVYSRAKTRDNDALYNYAKRWDFLEFMSYLRTFPNE